MIRTTILAATLAALTTPALALSCMRPDPMRAYQAAAEAEEAYVVVVGKLTFNERKLPEAVGNDSPPQTRIPARMTGKALSKSGFDHAFDRDITLEVLCYGPWCGGAGSGETYLTFLKRTDTGYVMSADPCGSMMFQDPKPKALRQIEQCYKNGRCSR